MIHAQTGIDTVLLDPVAVTDAATTATANLDCANADHVTIRCLFSAEENTNATASTLSLLHSDDTVVTNFATITADLTPDFTSAGEVRYDIDMLGKKRYLRLTYVAASTSGDITLGAVATLHRNDTDPQSTTEMGDDVVVIC